MKQRDARFPKAARIVLLTLSLPLAVSTVRAADEAKPADKDAAKVTYQDHVLPILRAKCGACHSADQAKGGLIVDSYTALMQGGGSGEVVVAGDLDGSHLWNVINHIDEPKMPPNEPKLPDETLAMIRKWIEGGALETASSKAKIKKPAFSLGTTVISSGKPEGPPPMPEGLSLEPLVVTPRGNAVTALATSPWAPLAAVSGHKQVLLYHTGDFRLLGVLPFPEGVPHVLKFSRNGSLLLAGGGRGGQSGRVVVWDVKTGKRVFEVGDEYDLVLAADISSDHSLIALGGPRRMVRVYNTSDGELAYELKKHTDWITAIEFSPDGVLLATGDRSNGVIVWEAHTGREFYVLNGHTGMINDFSWRLDSNVLASASQDGTIKLWAMVNGNLAKSWNAHGGGAMAVQFTRDSRIASTGRDRVTKLWDQNGAQQRAFPALPDIGLEVAFSSEDDRILAGDWSGAVRVWNAKDGVQLAELKTNPATLAERVAEAKAAFTSEQAAADQAAARLAALEKAEADKKAAAENAKKQAAEGEAAANAAKAEKAAADKAAAEAQAAVTAATNALNAAKAALEKANAEKAAAEKLVAEAAEDKKAEAEKALAEKATAQQSADAAFKQAEAAQQKAVADKAAADKAVADAEAKVKATADRAVALKQAAEKAAAAAVPNDATKKALADAAAAAKAAADKAALAKSRLDFLQAELGRSTETASAAQQ